MNYKSIQGSKNFWESEEPKCDYDEEVDENCSDEKSSVHDAALDHDFTGKMISNCMKNKGHTFESKASNQANSDNKNNFKRRNSCISSSNKKIEYINGDQEKRLNKVKSQNEENCKCEADTKCLRSLNSSNLAIEIKSLLGMLAEQRRKATSIVISQRKLTERGITATKGDSSNLHINSRSEPKSFEEFSFVTMNDIEKC